MTTAAPGRAPFAFAALAALALGAGACSRGPEAEFFGVRLGLSASDTRARFRPTGEGSWVMRSVPSPALEWSGSSPGAVPSRASFEFHQGMLVAARYELPGEAPAARGRPLEVTPSTVVSRQAAEGGGVRVVVLSRNCPEHVAEVRGLLAGAAKP
ncbi:MAG TPA: hypothetical protein VFS43_15290 [Polyangiaceae bacterium]|nr:hypothetical protein [Polyangiaceae bacterium]